MRRFTVRAVFYLRWRLLEKGTVATEPLIDAVFSADQMIDAFDAACTRGSLKILIDFGSMDKRLEEGLHRATGALRRFRPVRLLDQRGVRRENVECSNVASYQVRRKPRKGYVVG